MIELFGENGEGSGMALVMYCTMGEKELEVAVRCAARMQIDLYPYLLEKDDPEHCRKLVQDAYSKNVDAILCRGRILAQLRGLNCILPVVPNSIATKETMGILWNVKKRMTPEKLAKGVRVCLLTHQPLYINEELYSNVFGMSVHNVVLPYEKLNDMESFLRELKLREYDCVVCGQSIQVAADAMGLPTYNDFTSASENAVSDGLRTAAVVATATEAMKSSSESTQLMMDHAFEAVMMIDRDGKLRSVNRRARMQLKLKDGDWQGIQVWDLIPRIDENAIRRLLETGENIFGEVIDLGSFTAVMNISVVRKNAQIHGAVIQFTELQKIEQMETAVKNEYYSKGHFAKYHFEDVIGESEPVREAKQFGTQFAKYNSNVMILGETGIGKEVFAQSIHNASPRRGKPFVAINCGAIPLNLLESELFGYVDGAFTGASRKGRKGLMEVADGGTIFLDEISEMDLSGQVQLLRVLEERVIRKVGDNRVIPIDVRVIAASNRNLRQYVEDGKFREDLYYRLNVLTLNLPPLRQRGRDILLLAEDFLEVYGKKYHKLVTLSAEAEEVMLSYSWPGNIRQLRNFCERLIVVASAGVLDGPFIVRQLADSFMVREEEIRTGKTDISENTAKTAAAKESPVLPAVQADLLPEKDRILAALNSCAGNRKEAAVLLGMSKSTLWRKMKKYGIQESF